ncbi:hypothetical protein [Mesorhizobium sp. B2-3-5]|uniref:hypothetical protein n=1 Tax=Mesorhizobium sp. B2-3-5 TaxID=2589958 RepID=UPI0011261CA1|nr:hypothetical protein [Mesorhizobium sp. B2-3-5]TPM34311.1 hypothetical protein FJ958_07980 [Mesorhizobium sp. B2-3-5]
MIRSPGAYRFAVSTPPGWRSPAPTRRNRRIFGWRPALAGGLVSQDLPLPVGLAGRLADATHEKLYGAGRHG